MDFIDIRANRLIHSMKSNTVQIDNKTDQLLHAQKHLEDKIDAISCAIDQNKVQFKKMLSSSNRYSSEILWSDIFHDTIKESAWLTNQAFSPGRWAVGYPYLYVMYRTLNQFKPTCILELGLGQTTRMISQYSQSHPDVEHIVIEHDQKWIDFFKNDFQVSGQTEIMQCNIIKSTFKDDTEVTTYENLSEKLSGKKFDFISIDGPFGGKAKIYARIDVPLLMPDCLNESFVILLDDYERRGEKNTAIVMEEILNANDINYKKGTYRGTKDTLVLTSKNLGFLTSM